MAGRIGAAALSLLLAVATMIGVPRQAQAAVGQWTTNGPFGGAVRALEINPDNPWVMLAGTDGAGIFRSTDGGNTWQQTKGLPKPDLVFDISFARSDPSIVYAGTYEFGAVRSDDGGQTWSQIYSFATVTEIEADPFDPDIVFITDTQLRRSQDGGETWEDVWPAWQTAGVIVAAPSRPGRFYLGSADSVYRTDDWGESWWTDGYAEWWVEDLAVDPTDSRRVFAGTAHGVYRSTDGADTWHDADEGLPIDGGYHRRIVSVEIDPTQPSVIYAAAERVGGRIFRSVDSGAHWSPVPLEISSLPVWDIAAHPTNADRLFVGSDYDGVIRTRDGRQSWHRTNRGLIASNIASLLALPGTITVALAGTIGQGVFRTTDGGATWRREGLAGLDVEALASVPAKPRTVYAAAVTRGSGTRGGVYRSDDGGQTWRRTALRSRWIMDVAVAPSNPDVVYATDRAFAYRSRDGGASWSRIAGEGFFNSISVHPGNAGTVFLGSRSVLYRSSNAGNTWQPMLQGFVPLDVWSVAVDPTKPWIILVAADDGLWRTSNGGDTWRRKGAPPMDFTNIQEVVFDSSHPGRAYAAGVRDGGIFRSNDHGRTWSLLGSGIGSDDVGNVAMNATGRRIYAGVSGFNYSHGAGVFVYVYP